MKSLLRFSLPFLASTALATAVSSDTITQLEGAATQVDRIKILADDSDFVFNFLQSAPVKGAGGDLFSATATSFPAVIGNGMAMTLGVLGPCSLNTPHTHPRAAEMLLVLNGTLESGMLAENGARFVINQVPAFSATVFPKGSIHFQANLGCQPVMFAAALNDEDPGVVSISQRFFGLPPDIVGDSLGGLGVEYIAELAEKIPDNVALATNQCFQKCGFGTPPAQPTTQQQPRVSGNALPSATGNSSDASSTPPAPSGYSGSGSNQYPSKGNGSYVANPKGDVALAEDVEATPTASSSSSSSFLPNTSNPLVIASLALNGVLVLSLIGIVIWLCTRRKRDPTKMSAMPVTTGSVPRPLLAGTAAAKGKYAAAAYELPPEDVHVRDESFEKQRHYEDPYDPARSRAPSPSVGY